MKISIEMDAAPRDGESCADLEARVSDFLTGSHVAREAFKEDGIDVTSIEVVDRHKNPEVVDRVFLLEEEHEWPGGGQSWISVGDVPVRSLLWGAPEEREASGAVDLVDRLTDLSVGESLVHDTWSGGRTRFTRRT